MMPTQRNTTAGTSKAGSQAKTQTLADLLVEIQSLKSTIGAQQNEITELKKPDQSPAPVSTTPGLAPTLKAPSIPFYAGTASERSSTKVKNFIFSVKRIGRLTNATD